MNKKGELVLRNIIFMLIIFTGVMALSSIFVTEMADTYSNTNMTASYNQDSIGKDNLTATTSKWKGLGEDLSGQNGILAFLNGGLEAAGTVLIEVLKAPLTFGSMVTSVLTDFNVDDSVADIIGFIIAAVLYILIIFAIISAFLKGGKL